MSTAALYLYAFINILREHEPDIYDDIRDRVIPRLYIATFRDPCDYPDDDDGEYYIGVTPRLGTSSSSSSTVDIYDDFLTVDPDQTAVFHLQKRTGMFSGMCSALLRITIRHVATNKYFSEVDRDGHVDNTVAFEDDGEDFNKKYNREIRFTYFELRLLAGKYTPFVEL